MKKGIGVIIKAIVLMTVMLGMASTAYAADDVPIEIPNGDYTIVENGIYQLAEGYSGIITISSSSIVNEVTVTDKKYKAVHSNTSISVAGERTEALELTIEDINITAPSDKDGIDFGSAGAYENKLYMSGINNVNGAYEYTGIHAPNGVNLVINNVLNDEDAKLIVNGTFSAAGIGGRNEESGGTITINGGSVKASGGMAGAGIGGGRGIDGGGEGGTITINGGTVEAIGGRYGAGIGGGSNGEGGKITINGGTVTATTINAAGVYDCNAAGIGGGYRAKGGIITINGGTVTAIGGIFAAGIGGGSFRAGGTITISGGTVTATGGFRGTPGIGGGFGAGGGNVTIIGAPVVLATGNIYGQAQHIGKGDTMYADSGTLKNDLGEDLCYLRFDTKGVSGASIEGARIEIQGITDVYTTNDQGLIGIFVPSVGVAAYTVSKSGYVPVRGTQALDSVSYGIDITMVVDTTPPKSKTKKNKTQIINERIQATPLLNSRTGTAEFKVSTDMLKDAFSAGVANLQGITTAKIDIKKIMGAKSYETSLPADMLAGVSGKNIEIKTELATVTMPSNMLTHEMIGNATDVTLFVGNVDSSKLSEDVLKQIGERPVIELALKLDGKTISWNNSNVPVRVSIPYIPTQEELADPEHIVVWYIDSSGKAVSVPNGRYDSVTGMVTFTTTHFSYYAVASVNETFRDLNSVEWARKAIEVMASKDIINGREKNTFAPADNITRADYLVLLVKTLGLRADFEGNFDDVKSGTYYYEAVGIAKKLGIAEGSGKNLLRPKENISRQDMMTLTVRALEKQKQLKNTNDNIVLNKFSDKKDIFDYAKESLAIMVNEDLIMGSGEKLYPRAYTTRAEAAVFLYRIYNKY